MSDRQRSSGPLSRQLSDTHDLTQEALLADIATRYYVDRLTQAEIARRIGRSVATVSRLLAKAEAAEIVEVRVRYPVPVVPALQAALVNRFGLRTARVARVSSDESRSLVTQISDLAARYISTLLTDGSVIAVSWGSTVHGVVYAIPPGPQRDVHVVQGVGSLGSRMPSIDNPLLIQVLAERIDATPHYLPAPMIVESVAVRDALSRDPHFKATLDLGGHADIALVGIGPADPHLSGLVRAGYIEPWSMERIQASGGVGDLMVEFFDLSGQILETDFRQRVMGMREAELRNARVVVAVAGGTSKVQAILGALRTGLIHTLVTDNVTARKILELDDAMPAAGLTGTSAAGVPTGSSTGTRQQEAPARKTILEATLSLLAQDGFQQLSIEAVAARADVEKRAIYRWWPSKAALALDAAASVIGPPELDLGSLHLDLDALLSPLLRDGHMCDVGAHLAHKTMTAEAQLDPEFLRLYRDLHLTWRKSVVAAIERAKTRGELSVDASPGILADMLLGALWYRLLLDTAPIDTVYLGDLITASLGQRHQTDPASG